MNYAVVSYNINRFSRFPSCDYEYMYKARRYQDCEMSGGTAEIQEWLVEVVPLFFTPLE